MINYFSFGTAVGLLYYLLRVSGWTWQAGVGFSVALASGFLRLLASEAHADILTYAVFLAALCAAVLRTQARLAASLAWAILVPMKLIAVVFLMPALAADFVTSGGGWRKILRAYAPGAGATAVAVASVLIFDRFTIGAWLPSHEHSTLHTAVAAVRGFLISVPREFLFNWHGTTSARFPRVAFPVSLGLAAICLISLRPEPEGKWLRVYGVTCLACSALLLCVRYFDPSVRLTGYGLLVLVLGFRPQQWANSVWLFYGAVGLTIGVVNAITVNSLGAADPRYSGLAQQVRAYGVSGVVATNSFHILDLDADVASVPVTSYAQADRYGLFLWVTLPGFDPAASTVNVMGYPGPGWCERQRFSGGILFSRCAP